MKTIIVFIVLYSKYSNTIQVEDEAKKIHETNTGFLWFLVCVLALVIYMLVCYN